MGSPPSLWNFCYINCVYSRCKVTIEEFRQVLIDRIHCIEESSSNTEQTKWFKNGQIDTLILLDEYIGAENDN